MPDNPASLPYGDLSQCSDDYKEMAPVWEAIDDFYKGGYVLAKKVGKYIPRLVGENQKRYRERIKSGAYINYFAEITDYFAAALFTQELAVRPPADAKDKQSPGESPDEEDDYAKFSKNADRNGHSLNEVLHDVLVTALKQRGAWLRVEMPPATEVASRADEEALGLGLPYLFEVPHASVIDWDWDDDGELSYAVIRTKKKLKGPPGRRKNVIRETYEVWLADVDENDDDADTQVTWGRYVIEYDPNKPPVENTPCRLVEEGTTTFSRIPLLYLEISDGLWIGNKLCPMAKEHFARRTSLNAAEDRSMVAIPVAKLGAEMPAPQMPISEAQEDPNRGQDPVATFLGKGYEVIGKDDSLEFVEPVGAAYAHVAQRIEDLKAEMFRVSHQMAASVSMQASGNVRRSGESKKEDRFAEALVLAALGRVIRNFGVRIYDTISQARGEDVRWVPHGLDTYELDDREQVLEESMGLQSVDIPSPTFRKEHAKRTARKLVPNMTPSTIAQIDKEIDEGVEDEQVLRDLEHKNEVEDAKNPQPPAGPPGVAPPQPAKAPTAKPPKAPAAKAAKPPKAA